MKMFVFALYACAFYGLFSRDLRQSARFCRERTANGWTDEIVSLAVGVIAIAVAAIPVVRAIVLLIELFGKDEQDEN